MSTLTIYIPNDAIYDHFGESLRNFLENQKEDGVVHILIMYYLGEEYKCKTEYIYEYDGNVDYVSEGVRETLEDLLLDAQKSGHTAKAMFSLD